MADTIIAPATAWGRAGVGVIRISGIQVRAIAEKLLGQLPKPRLAHYAAFKNHQQQIIDKGLALFFPAPHSFTGEDVLELQVHGSPIVMNSLIQRVLALGARLARPGEFSERAFLNHKMDLAQAEAVADLINAGSEQAARAAMQSLEGAFSQQIHEITEKLIQLRIYIEAALDFPEEEIDFLNDAHIQARLEAIINTIVQLQVQAKQGVLLQQGMTIVIAGKPNAGKSSLLNQLSGRDSAIVTAIAGTTRDIVRENINIDGLPLQIIDTAGLRESSDAIEQEGIKRAREAIQKADCVLYLKDITAADDISLEEDALLQHPHVIVIYNKIDLAPRTPLSRNVVRGEGLGVRAIKLSARTGEGIDTLKKALKARMGFTENTETAFSARQRHVDALKRASECLNHAKHQLISCNAGECAAEELRLAQQALSEITGEFTTEDLLGRIFSDFCIGK